MNIIAQGNINTGYKTALSITAGETVALAIQISVGGTALNLAGYSLKCQINLPEPLLLTTANSGITVTSASTGSIQVNIASSVSALFAPGSYPYDLWMTSGGGIETPLLAGNFTVTASVSPVP